MDIMESFETSSGGQYGDLLSERPKEKILKIGLITCGFFEYWRMYPGTLKENVIADMTRIYECLRKKFDSVIWPGLVDTLDRAEEAGKMLENERVDLCIYVAGTYCPDYMGVHVLSHIRNVPLIMFNVQGHNEIDLKCSYEDTLRNSGLISNVQLAGAFRKMGWYKDLKVVVGTIEEEGAYKEIKKYSDALQTYNNLKTMNIGVIGHVFRGMYDFEYDKTIIKGVLGPNVINIQVDYLIEEYKKMEDNEVRYIVELARERFDIIGLDEDDIIRSAKFYLSEKRMFERFRLDALTLLGQHYTEQKTGSTAYLGNTLIHEEGKYIINTEGDLHGLIMMCIINKLTGQTPLFAEWGEYDEIRNAILFMHHGYGNPSYAKNYESIKVNRSPEQWGLQGNGFGFEFTAKAGVVTIAHLIIDTEGYKMLITSGETIDVPGNIPCEEITALVKLKKPIKQFIKELIKEGFAHHAIIAFGDITDELGYVADFMNIRKVIL